MFKAVVSSIRYKLACAIKKDSNQSAYPYSLIRVVLDIGEEITFDYRNTLSDYYIHFT